MDATTFDAVTWELRRDRLIGLLHRRWDVPLTTVIGGAGVGKTVLLRQMMTSGRLAQHGIDVALDAADLSTAAVDVAMREATAGRAGDQPICIAVDDAHRADPAALGALCDRADVHVVLFARHEPPVAIDRRDLEGDVVRIDDAALRFDAGERAIAPVDLDRWDGWVAPAVLDATRGDVAAARYIAAEVVAELSPDAVELLDLLAAVPELDDHVAGDALGRSVSIGRELATVPTLARAPATQLGHDRYSVAGLWSSQLRADVDRAEPLGRVVAAFEGQGRMDDAVRVATEHRSTGALARLQRRVALDRLCVSMPALRRLADAGERSAARVALEAFVARVDAPELTTTERLLEESFALAADDDVDLCMETLGHLGLLAFLRQDLDAAFELLGRSRRYVDRASAGLRNAHALAAHVSAEGFDSYEAAVEAIGRIDPAPMARHWRQGRSCVLGSALLALGDPTSVGHLREGVAADFPYPAIRGLTQLAEFRCGAADGRVGGSGELGDRAANALIAAALGRTEGLLDEVAHLRGLVPGRVPQVGALLAATEAWALLDGGDRPAARAALERGVAAYGVVGHAGAVFRQVPLLFAELWPDGPDPQQGFDGSVFTRDRLILEAWLALRADEDAAPAPEILELAAPEIVGSLGLRAGLELSLAIANADPATSSRWTSDLVDLYGRDARAALRALVDVPHLGSAARRMLAEYPVPSRHRIELRLLGTARLLVDGIDVEHENWRRERVRALLAYLAVHPRCHRDSVVGALWPDVAPDAARNRFRSTLNRLLAAVDPERRPGEASSIVRASGDELELLLARDAVDVWTFESLLDRAEDADRRGQAELALDGFVDALSLWSGAYLTEHDDDWSALERERLRARFLSASTRAAELLLAADRTAEAIAVLHRLLAAEPWSEYAHRLLIHAHARRDDRAAVRRAMARGEHALSEIGGALAPLASAVDQP